jgi:hypothetical protein
MQSLGCVLAATVRGARGSRVPLIIGLSCTRQSRRCRATEPHFHAPEWATRPMTTDEDEVTWPICDRRCRAWPIRSFVRATEPPAGPGGPRVYRAPSLSSPGRVTAAPDDRIGLESRLLPICCPRRAIHGRSSAERVCDLGWS